MKVAASVGITLGGGPSLVITTENHLVITNIADECLFDFGLATMSKFNDLKEFVDRLSIHAIDKP